VIWKAIARSQIGTSHIKQQISCQDYSDYCIFNNLILGAVADGAGSAKFADIGAKLAVKTVLSYLCEYQVNKPYWQERSRPRSEQPIREMFTQGVKRVVYALQEEARHNDYSFQDLACTLLVFVATPYWIAAMQIGDGFIVICPQQGNYQLLFPPDKGEFANETTFVTSASALSEMQICVQPGKQEFICASTDGLERVAIQIRDWAPFPPFFNPLQEYLNEIDSPETEDEYIQTFLESERLNHYTNDDKTLLLCLFNR
jgi:serine/threonine protein phosphatase PrpC